MNQATDKYTQYKIMSTLAACVTMTCSACVRRFAKQHITRQKSGVHLTPSTRQLKIPEPVPPSVLNLLLPGPPSILHLLPGPPGILQLSPGPPSILHLSPGPPNILHLLPRPPGILHLSPGPPGILHLSPGPPGILHLSPGPPGILHLSHLAEASSTESHG